MRKLIPLIILIISILLISIAYAQQSATCATCGKTDNTKDFYSNDEQQNLENAELGVVLNIMGGKECNDWCKSTVKTRIASDESFEYGDLGKLYESDPETYKEEIRKRIDDASSAQRQGDVAEFIEQLDQNYPSAVSDYEAEFQKYLSNIDFNSAPDSVRTLAADVSCDPPATKGVEVPKGEGRPDCSAVADIITDYDAGPDKTSFSFDGITIDISQLHSDAKIDSNGKIIFPDNNDNVNFVNEYAFTFEGKPYSFTAKEGSEIDFSTAKRTLAGGETELTITGTDITMPGENGYYIDLPEDDTIKIWNEAGTGRNIKFYDGASLSKKLLDDSYGSITAAESDVANSGSTFVLNDKGIIGSAKMDNFPLSDFDSGFDVSKVTSSEAGLVNIDFENDVMRFDGDDDSIFGKYSTLSFIDDKNNIEVTDLNGGEMPLYIGYNTQDKPSVLYNNGLISAVSDGKTDGDASFTVTTFSDPDAAGNSVIDDVITADLDVGKGAIIYDFTSMMNIDVEGEVKTDTSIVNSNLKDSSDIKVDNEEGNLGISLQPKEFTYNAGTPEETKKTGRQFDIKASDDDDAKVIMSTSILGDQDYIVKFEKGEVPYMYMKKYPQGQHKRDYNLDEDEPITAPVTFSITSGDQTQTMDYIDNGEPGYSFVMNHGDESYDFTSGNNILDKNSYKLGLSQAELDMALQNKKDAAAKSNAFGLTDTENIYEQAYLTQQIEDAVLERDVILESLKSETDAAVIADQSQRLAELNSEITSKSASLDTLQKAMPEDKKKADKAASDANKADRDLTKAANAEVDLAKKAIDSKIDKDSMTLDEVKAEIEQIQSQEIVSEDDADRLYELSQIGKEKTKDPWYVTLWKIPLEIITLGFYDSKSSEQRYYDNVEKSAEDLMFTTRYNGAASIPGMVTVAQPLPIPDTNAPIIDYSSRITNEGGDLIYRTFEGQDLQDMVTSVYGIQDPAQQADALKQIKDAHPWYSNTDLDQSGWKITLPRTITVSGNTYDASVTK
ncbi:hypothetical protein H6503_03720 [Candidatus Woesearchaeota archaeon]|nr:hypothetical protein [Candidatus Woesearchaeota archaeon]